MAFSRVGKVDCEGLRTVTSMRERILEAMNIGEPYTSGDLADELGEGKRIVHYHLDILAEEGRVHKKKHSSQNVTWYRSE